MSDIGPGDWIEAVATATEPYSYQCIRQGAIYHCEDVAPATFGICPRCGTDGEAGVGVVEAPVIYPGGQRGAWPLCLFRPIYRPKSSLIQGLLEPVHA